MQNKQPSTPSLTHWKLLNILHSTEFVWLLSGDDNRAADGVELRVDFIFECEIPDNPDWRALGCSILEMLIAFSRRAEFATEISATDWFWDFLENLGLREFDDGAEYSKDDVDSILQEFIWRTYNKKGEGGLFPMNNPKEDQRKVEVWYQFCEYIVEQNIVA